MMGWKFCTYLWFEIVVWCFIVPLEHNPYDRVCRVSKKMKAVSLAN